MSKYIYLFYVNYSRMNNKKDDEILKLVRLNQEKDKESIKREGKCIIPEGMTSIGN